MTVRFLTDGEDLKRYETWLHAHPQATLWQSLGWKKYQEELGREVRVYVAEKGGDIRASALVVIDRTSFGLSTWDIPRGPLGIENDQTGAVRTLLIHLQGDARKEGCMSIFLSPLQTLPVHDIPMKSSPRHEQPEATRVIDVRLTDEEILQQMHSKGRYNIHVAEKHNVRVKQSQDIDAFHTLLQETAGRDKFRVGAKNQYKAFLQKVPGAFLLMAHEADGSTPIAGLLGVIYGATGYYYYGASSYEHRALMAPFLLQWEAMHHCKKAGCSAYDLLGIAPPDADADHPWEGISSFKAKFGGEVVTFPPEQQIVLRPLMRALIQAKRRMLG